MRPVLTPVAYIVLGLLERMGEASPYELKRESSATVGKFWSTPHSQMYRTVEVLADRGYITGRDDPTPGGRPKRVYTLTDKGHEALAKWRKAPPGDPPELRDAGLLKVYFGADPVAVATARVDAHRRQLAALEETKARDTGGEPRGPWLTLDAGIAHEKVWVKFWERLARG